MEHVLAGRQHSSRLLHLSLSCEPGGACWNMLKRTWEQFRTPSLWAHLPRTECTCTDILRYGLRPAATVYYLVISVYRNLPYLLLHLLTNPESSKDFEEGLLPKTCCHDAYSKAFFQRYPTATDMTSLEAKLELRMLGMLGMANSFDVERLHSSTARRSRTRPHTHTRRSLVGSCPLEGRVGSTNLGAKPFTGATCLK